MRRILATLVFLVVLAVPATALADSPVVTPVQVDFAVTIPGDQNPCGFDLVFTGVGDITVTTFGDGREISHGILTHTIASQWHTLSSIGPASVHTDLATGASTDTGMEFSFHVAGEGLVFAQAGNFTFLPDGTVIEHGLDRFSLELCQVLAP
ncbi:MAG TPA: hypothetical protein VF101_11375 [Gaiellaceae bacterium]